MRYRKKYTKEEDDVLRKYYQTTKARELGEKLGRDEGSIISRAFKLGLKKDKEFMLECSKAGQFKKGHSPHNKGKKQTEYMS